MIKIDTKQTETLIYDIATTGVRDPSSVVYRLFMSLTESFELCLTGKHNDGELIITVPALRDIINIQDKQIVPYKIEALFTDYTQVIMESELILLNPPQVEIEKLTQIKKEPIKEEVKPIKIEEKIILKPKSKFAENFEIFVKEKTE